MSTRAKRLLYGRYVPEIVERISVQVVGRNRRDHSHNFLRPENDLAGWEDLVGFRRYQYDPGSAERRVWMQEFLTGTGLTVSKGDPAGLDIQAIRFDSYLIAHMQAAGISFHCDRSRTRVQERYVFLFVNQGSLTVEGTASHWASANGGMCIIFPGAEPFEIHVPEHGEGILFSVTEDEIAPFGLTPNTIGDLQARSSVFRASYAFLRATVAPPIAPEDGEETALMLRSMIREVARGLTHASTATTKARGLFNLAQRTIEDRCADPDFDVTALGRHCAVSRRTLDRAYQAQGLRVAQELRRARARLAMPLIAGGSPVSVREIAELSGFRSIDSMRRALKEAYGLAFEASPTGNPTESHARTPVQE